MSLKGLSLRTRVVVTLAAGCACAAPAPAVAAGAKLGSRPLSSGARGADVRTLQRDLTRLGFRTPADGVFGPSTKSSVVKFERRYHLRADGRLTVSEERSLLRALARRSVAADSAPAVGDGGAFWLPPPAKAQINADGTATPPASAPAAVKAIIAAGNKIAHKPYVYGGGHGKWNDRGYDCSGSVSYALHGAGLLDTALDSTSFESWGSSGPGRWVTIYANAGHAYMVVAGMRFDTSGLSSAGTRWHRDMRPSSGYVVRHPPGL